MKSIRILIMLSLLLLTISTVSATISQNGIVEEYDSEVSVTIEDGIEGDPTSGVWLDACGEEQVSYASANYAGQLDFPVTLRFKVPEEVSCGNGLHSVVAYASEFDSGTEKKIGETYLDITPRNMERNKGKYLYVRMNKRDGKSDILKSFLISDSNWKPTDVEQGGIGVQEVDGGPPGNLDTCFYDSADGEKVTEEYSSSNLDSGAIEELYGPCEPNRDGYGPQDVLQTSFAAGVDDGVIPPNRGGPGNPLKDWELDSWSPVHRDGSYYPDGEIIRGYEPLHYTNDGDDRHEPDGPYWFVCRESSDGKTVSADSQGRTSLYRCDAHSGDESWRDDQKNDWEQVAQCQDGLDNDGEGNVDLEDPYCDGNPEKELEGPLECVPVVSDSVTNTEGDNINQKVALYDTTTDGQYSPEGLACEYNSIDEEPGFTGQPATQFECYDAGGGTDQTSAVASVNNYEGPESLSDDAQEFCNNRLALVSSFSQNPMPASLYFVPKRAMQQGTAWAGENGFRPNYRFQTLHMAEIKYSSPGTEHDVQLWSVDRNMENTDGYLNDNPENYIDAWDVSNATGIYNEDVNYPFRGTLPEGDVFDGGFHGVCEPGLTWVRNNDEWLCDVGEVSDQSIEINTYGGLNGDLGGKLAGFQIDWEEMRKWQGAHPSAPPEGGGGVNPLKIRAMCWQGGPDERPQNLNEAVNLSASVNEEETTYVVGRLPERSTTPSNPNSYACVLGMSQFIRTDLVTTSSETVLFTDGTEGTKTSQVGESYGYITEGTDVSGGIETVEDPIQPAEDMQQWLDGKQANEFSGELWPNFRKQEDLTDSEVEGGPPCQQIRHPMNFVDAGCNDN